MRGLENILPRSFGHWVAVRFGIYLTAAVLTALVSLLVASSQAGVDYHLSSPPMLGLLIGLGLAGGIKFLLSSGKRASHPPIMSSGERASLRIWVHRFENNDEVTAAAALSLLVRAIASGADLQTLRHLIWRATRR
jgi:hypothetical protein